MSGFAITLDAILAVMVAVFLIVWATDMVYGRELQDKDLLPEYTYDFLTVAEKSGAIANVTSYPDNCPLMDDGFTYSCTAPLRDFINRMPYSVCIDMEIHTQNGTLFYHADTHNDIKLSEQVGKEFQSGCLKKYGLEEARPVNFVKASRLITEKGQVWYVKAEVWYRGWKG